MFRIPILIDKSAFESLSNEEAKHVFGHGGAFDVVLTDLLAMEIFGSLAKDEYARGVAWLKSLAGRIDPTGSVPCASYREIFVANALGIPVQDGLVPLAKPQVSSHPEVELYGQGPLDEVIRHWKYEPLIEGEYAVAVEFRQMKGQMPLENFLRPIKKRSIILPRVHNCDRAVMEAENLLGKKSLQNPLLNCFLELITYPDLEDAARRASVLRQLQRGFWLKKHAPYCYHCIRAYLATMIAWKHRLIRQHANNGIDMAYMFYLPFCAAFVSSDHLHSRLAKPLMRSDQLFVSGKEFRANIQESMKVREHIPPNLDGLDPGLEHNLLNKLLRSRIGPML